MVQFINPPASAFKGNLPFKPNPLVSAFGAGLSGEQTDLDAQRKVNALKEVIAENNPIFRGFDDERQTRIASAALEVGAPAVRLALNPESFQADSGLEVEPESESPSIFSRIGSALGFGSSDDQAVDTTSQLQPRTIADIQNERQLFAGLMSNEGGASTLGPDRRTFLSNRTSKGISSIGDALLGGTSAIDASPQPAATAPTARERNFITQAAANDTSRQPINSTNVGRARNELLAGRLRKLREALADRPEFDLSNKAIAEGAKEEGITKIEFVRRLIRKAQERGLIK